MLTLPVTLHQLRSKLTGVFPRLTLSIMEKTLVFRAETRPLSSDNERERRFFFRLLLSSQTRIRVDEDFELVCEADRPN